MTEGNGDRVPDSLWQQGDDETTPCGPHCHQGALIERLADSVREIARDAGARHADVLSALSSLTGTVQGLETVTRGLQAQVTSVAIAVAQTANLAGQTASHVALSDDDAARHAPAESLPPLAVRKRRGAIRLVAAVVGTILGAGAAEYATRVLK